jgi:hypothetical protein
MNYSKSKRVKEAKDVSGSSLSGIIKGAEHRK